MRRFSLLIFALTTFVSVAQDHKITSKLDSIFKYRELSRDYNLENNIRLEYARNASKLSQNIEIDTTILKSDLNLSGIYLDLDMYNQFREINHKSLKLSQRLNDTISTARIFYFLGWYHTVESDSDSAYYYYYNAEKAYRAIGDIQNNGEVLLNMADIQETAKDYIGSEETAVKAISLIEQLPETDRNLDTLWSLYNLLAVISERLQQRDQAIENYEKCLEIAQKMSQPLFYVLNSRNNMAFSYEQKGDLSKALLMYYDLIEDKRLKQISPELYAIVLGNIANTKFKSENVNIEEINDLYKEAYRISDSLEDPIRKMGILPDWAQFYFDTGKKQEALLLSKESYNLAKESNTNTVYLKALKLMSDIEGGEKGKQYLDEYIKLNDSLVNKERESRNKFARIRFEVDKIEADNIQLSRERLLFLIISIGLLLSLTLLYIVITQRARNRKLEFIQKQQEANEEIYNLMLAQQDKIEEGRTHEKKRISEELHDGILGKLFGTRLSLDSLNLLQTEEAAKSRSQYINELKNIETEIRKISHDLNSDFIGDSGFIDIIKTLIETQTTAYELEYEFANDNSIDWEIVPNRTKIHIYRMLQETMQNIYKHANANLVKISFKLKNDVILCAIEDDGSGFNVNKARKGIGLKNINSRISEVGGKAEIFSKIDVGTIIKISIPVQE